QSVGLPDSLSRRQRNVVRGLTSDGHAESGDLLSFGNRCFDGAAITNRQRHCAWASGGNTGKNRVVREKRYCRLCPILNACFANSGVGRQDHPAFESVETPT